MPDLDQLMALVDRVRDRLTPAAVVLGASVQGKASLIVSVSAGLVRASRGGDGQERGGPVRGKRRGQCRAWDARGAATPQRLKDAVAKAKAASLGEVCRQLRLLGVDYGKTRTGLALSDPLGVTCRPLAVLTERDADRLVGGDTCCGQRARGCSRSW